MIGKVFYLFMVYGMGFLCGLHIAFLVERNPKWIPEWNVVVISLLFALAFGGMLLDKERKQK